MSSRTAAGRKRIKEAPTKEPKPIKEKKGLFSRSKSAAPKADDREPSVLPSPPGSLGDRPGFSSPQIRVSRTEAPKHVQHFDGYPPQPPSKYTSSPPSQYTTSSPRSTVATTYSSPQEQPRVLSSYHEAHYADQYAQDRGPPPTVKKSSSTGNMLNMYASEEPYYEGYSSPTQQTYLEASYQPPPPPRARTGRASSASPMPQLSPSSTHRSDRGPGPTPHGFSSRQRSPAGYAVTSPQLSELDMGPSEFTTAPIQSNLLLESNQAHATASHFQFPSYQPFPGSQPPHQTSHLQVTTKHNIERGRRAPAHPGNHKLYPSPPSSDSDLRLAYLDSPEQKTPSTLRAHPPIVQHEEAPVSPSESNLSYPHSEEQWEAIYDEPRTTTSSPRSSISSDKRKPGAPNFVFPGSRSAVVPKVTSTGKTRLNVTGKPSKNKSTTPTEEASPHNRDSAYSGQQTSTSGSSKASSHSGGGGLAVEDRVRKMSTATTGTTGTTSTNSSGKSGGSNGGFVYPGSRSRAKPKSEPLNIKFKKPKLKPSDKSLDSSDSGSGKRKFMGITIKKRAPTPGVDQDRPPTPPSPMAKTLYSSMYDYEGEYEGSVIRSTTSNGGPAPTPEIEAYREIQMSPEMRRQERVRRIKSRIGSYPLDPYDSILLDK